MVDQYTGLYHLPEAIQTYFRMFTAHFKYAICVRKPHYRGPIQCPIRCIKINLNEILDLVHFQLTLFILMDCSMHIDTISTELSIFYYKGLLVKNSIKCCIKFPSLKIVFILANRTDPAINHSHWTNSWPIHWFISLPGNYTTYFRMFTAHFKYSICVRKSHYRGPIQCPIQCIKINLNEILDLVHFQLTLFILMDCFIHNNKYVRNCQFCIIRGCWSNFYKMLH